MFTENLNEHLLLLLIGSPFQLLMNFHKTIEVFFCSLDSAEKSGFRQKTTFRVCVRTGTLCVKPIRLLSALVLFIVRYIVMGLIVQA